MDIAPKRSAYGFTLLEFMVTLLVAGLLLFVAVPAFNDLIFNSKRVAAVNSFVSRLHYTRSEAVKRGVKVIFCLSTQTQSCMKGPSTSWREGIVFPDYDSDGKRDATEPVLSVFRVEPGIDIYASSIQRRKIKYYPDGSAPVSNTTVRFCDPSGKGEPRAVIISNSGRSRVSNKDAVGKALRCPKG